MGKISYKKMIYCIILIAVVGGCVIGMVINLRISIMCFLLLALMFFNNYISHTHYDVDKIYVFLFITLFPFNRIGLAVTRPDTLLLRYVNDYCNLAILDLIIFLFFLQLLRIHTTHGKKDKYYSLLLLFLGFNTVSLFQSTNISATVWTCIRCLKLLAIFNYYKYCFDFNKHKKALFSGSFVAVGFQFIVSLGQYIKKETLGLSFLGEVTSLAKREVDGTTSFRPSGTFEHPANMAFFAMFIFTLCLYEEKMEKKIRGIAIVCSLSLIFMAGSRTIMGLTALAIVIWVKTNGLKTKKNFSLMLLGASGGLILLSLTSALESIIDIFVNSDWSAQILNRTTQWALLMSYIIQKPILGYGANTYTDITEILANSTVVVSTKFYLSNPCHNIYLQLWFDLGIGGMVIYVTMLIGGMKQYFNSALTKIQNYRSIFISCFAFICNLMIYNFTGWAGLKDQTNFLLYMTLGLLFTNFYVKCEE